MDESRTPQTYQEFVEMYGKRPPDIVFAVTQKDTRAETLKEIEKELFEIVHSRTKAAAYNKAVELWKSVSGELPKE